jgi:hypothetical protein
VLPLAPNKDEGNAPTMETMKLRTIQLPGNAGAPLDGFIRVEAQRWNE